MTGTAEDDVLRRMPNTASKPHESAGESTGDTYSEAETTARAEATLKQMLATPHKPHKEKPDDKARKP